MSVTVGDAPTRRLRIGKLFSICAFALAPLASCGDLVDYCGEGTHADHGVCRPDNADTPCGSGTTLVDGTCVVASDGGPGGDASVGVGVTGDGGVSSEGGTSPLDAGFGIDPTTACLGTTDNIFVIAGDDWVHSGDNITIQGGAGWASNIPYTVDGQPSWVTINVGTSWILDFSTKSLGVPLTAGTTYENAQGAYDTDPNRPGMDVMGGAACDRVDGTFTVIDVAPDLDAGYPVVQSFTAYWQERCVEGTGIDIGCIHYSHSN